MAVIEFVDRDVEAKENLKRKKKKTSKQKIKIKNKYLHNQFKINE